MYGPLAEEATEGTTERGGAAQSWFGAFVRRLFSLAAAGQRRRLLRVRDTLSLGEKRFIAVVQYDRQKFLIAGTAQNISLLQRLDDEAEDEHSPADSRTAFEMKQAG